MACDAIARLYDVDNDSAQFTKLDRTKKYDQGTFVFRARPGRLIDLKKLHESVWATRLSDGTRSGLMSLEVTAVGSVVQMGDEVRLKVSGSDAEFILKEDANEEGASTLSALLAEAQTGVQQIKVTGVIDNYRGRWPKVLEDPPPDTRAILVSAFERVE